MDIINIFFEFPLVDENFLSVRPNADIAIH